MNDEVKRYVTTCDCMSEAAWGDYVRHSDYEALRTQVAELRAENERLRAGMVGDFDLDAWLDWSKEAQRLRGDLETARGLLEQRIPCDVMLPPATTIKRGCPLSTVLISMKMREDVPPNQRVFTDTPAPEVQQAGQGAVTVERDMMGTMHIKLGDFDAVQVRYQYPYTDNASTKLLAERIADMLRNQQAEQGERQETVAGQNSLCTGQVTGTTCISAIFPDGKIQRFVPEHSVQDVRGLVEALEEIVKQYPNPNITHIDYRVHACQHAEQALADHRQAQQEGEKG